jgi:hypothetical protein
MVHTWFDDLYDNIIDEEKKEKLEALEDERNWRYQEIDKAIQSGEMSSEDAEFYSTATYDPESDYWDEGAVRDPC